MVLPAGVRHASLTVKCGGGVQIIPVHPMERLENVRWSHLPVLEEPEHHLALVVLERADFSLYVQLPLQADDLKILGVREGETGSCGTLVGRDGSARGAYPCSPDGRARRAAESVSNSVRHQVNGKQARARAGHRSGFGWRPTGSSRGGNREARQLMKLPLVADDRRRSNNLTRAVI